MPTIDDVIAFARSLIGCTADPSTPFRAEYLDLVAPGETPARQAEMALMYNCELLCRAILRRFIAHPRLVAPYVDGMAGRDLMAIANEAAALRRPGELPRPGDIVLVSPPEHAWFALDTVTSTYDGTTLLHGVEGLPVDGFRAVATRLHEIRDGRDDAGSSRAIVAVIDVGRVLAAFGG